jgi:hypothetical protein
MDLMFMHTPKAVKAGHPADRLFLVTAPMEGGRKGKPEYLAWKCTVTKNGIEHPGYKKPLSVDKVIEGAGRSGTYKNGSMPTAIIKPDSFYKMVSTHDLRALVKNSEAVGRVASLNNDVKLFKQAEAKLTKEERIAIFRVLHNIGLSMENAEDWCPPNKS